MALTFPDKLVEFVFFAVIDGKAHYVCACPRCRVVHVDVPANLEIQCSSCGTLFCHDGCSVMDCTHPPVEDGGVFVD